MAKQSAYYEIDGQKLIRVTSVLGQTLAKPALIPWAKKATREGAVTYLKTVTQKSWETQEPEGDRTPVCGQTCEQNKDQGWISVTSPFKSGHDVPPSHEECGCKVIYQVLDRADFIKEVGQAAKGGTDITAATNRGRDFHEAAMDYMGGDPYPDIPGMQALKQWRADLEPRPVDLENVVYSRTLGCAGTFEALMEIDGKRVIVDYKTGGVYDDHAIQLAAYAGMWGEMSKDRPIDACQVVQVDTVNATYTVHHLNDWKPYWENGFLPLLKVWKQMQGNAFISN